MSFNTRAKKVRTFRKKFKKIKRFSKKNNHHYTRRHGGGFISNFKNFFRKSDPEYPIESSNAPGIVERGTGLFTQQLGRMSQRSPMLKNFAERRLINMEYNQKERQENEIRKYQQNRDNIMHATDVLDSPVCGIWKTYQEQKAKCEKLALTIERLRAANERINNDQLKFTTNKALWDKNRRLNEIKRTENDLQAAKFNLDDSESSYNTILAELKFRKIRPESSAEYREESDRRQHYQAEVFSLTEKLKRLRAARAAAAAASKNPPQIDYYNYDENEFYKII
jgi:hypothetical protein